MEFSWEIFWKEYSIYDDFSHKIVKISGWSHNNHDDADPERCNPVGIFNSYVSAMADAMGLWEEYCEYHRTRGLH